MPVSAQTLDPADHFSKAVEKLKESTARLEEEATIENRIDVAAWKIMLGELAVRDGENVSQWSMALDAFEEGLTEIEQIQNELSLNTELEKEVSSKPDVVIKLDTALARGAAIEERRTLAREEERARLNQLREIAVAFKTLLDKTAEADLYFKIGEMEKAKASNQDALQMIENIEKIAKQRTDYFLLSDEPRLEEQDELASLQSTPQPLSIPFTAHRKALQGLAFLRIAQSVEYENKDEYLKQAAEWANMSLGNGDSAAVTSLQPDGEDSNNYLAYYVIGNVNLLRAKLITAPAPVDNALHENARSLLEEARSALEKSLALVKASTGEGEAIDLAAELTQTLESLTSSDYFLEQAAAFTLEGTPEKSESVLNEAILIYREPQVWASLINARLRTGASAEELEEMLQQVEKQGLFPEDNLQVQIDKTRFLVDILERKVSSDHVAGISVEERNQLVSRLKEEEALLLQKMNTVDDELLKSRLQAYVALDFVYQNILNPQAPAEHDNEIYQYSRDAISTLTAHLQNAPLSMDAVEYREALIAAHWAYGFLSVRVLPDYREDAILAFAAANDQTAKLPYERKSGTIMGSPLLTAIFNRPENASGILAQKEKDNRIRISRFLEGLFVMQFGDPGNAADQITRALNTSIEQSDSSNQSVIDATESLEKTDGFDDQITLQDSMRAFQVLADVKAGEHSRAYVTAIKLVTNDTSLRKIEDITREHLAQAEANTLSPLLSYALFSAIDARLLDLPLDQIDERELLITTNKKVLANLHHQLENHRTAERYPYLVQLSSNSQQAYESSQSYLVASAELQSNVNDVAAIHSLEEGLKRHPRSYELWQAYFSSQIGQVNANTDSDSTLALLKQIEVADQLEMISSFQSNYFAAMVLEQSGNELESLNRYLLASSQASTPRESIQVQSKIARLRLQLVAPLPATAQN
ncbi:MAG: hypothetical protein R3C11_00370 [Planctomycetaceae bacterium]